MRRGADNTNRPESVLQIRRGARKRPDSGVTTTEASIERQPIIGAWPVPSAIVKAMESSSPAEKPKIYAKLAWF